MNKLPMNYKKAFFTSLGLHAVLLIFFLLSFAFSDQSFSPIQQNQPQIVEATTFNQQQLNQEITKIKNEKLAEQQAEKQKIEKLEQQAKEAEQKRIAEQTRIQELKQAQLAAQKQAATELNKLKQQQQAEQERLTKLAKAEKTIEKPIEKPVTPTTKKAVAEKKEQSSKKKLAENQESEKLLQQQLAKEQAELSASRQKFVDSIIAKYTALIKNAIASKWIIPPGADKSLSCVLLINLLADGSVVSVEVNKSSGDAALDNSAVLAVKKASPLPMPDNADVLSQFKTLYLTVKPETVLEG